MRSRRGAREVANPTGFFKKCLFFREYPIDNLCSLIYPSHLSRRIGRVFTGTTFARKAMAENKAITKSAIFQELAEQTGLSRKQVASVFDALSGLIKRELSSKKGAGVFTVPGLLKLTTVKKKAVPARKGIDPFTKQERMFKARAARTVVKARPLKALKDMVQ
jgi:nucleoid DNA-binding protein